MQVKCSMKNCESTTEVTNPSPMIRFICRNHERADVKRHLGVKRYDPSKDEDRNARFDNHAFENELRKNNLSRDGEQPEQDFSTGVVGIPFDRT
jgi:hypothetical protein